MMKKAQQMRTMLPMGLREVMRVSTTSFRPGARLITLVPQRSNQTKVSSGSTKVEWFKEPEGENVPQRAQRSEQSEHPEHSQDLGPARHGHHDVNQRHKDQEAVQNVPAAPQVRLLAHVEAHGDHLSTRGEASEEGRGSPPTPAASPPKGTFEEPSPPCQGLQNGGDGAAEMAPR